ncbi:MAG: hypothetical protein A2234_08935 [Elusimicrobia bacterium RIFOXYA2_FULL_58_8]|nr:MAG: hypothetical protein A2285_03190 [Elusimicrobia bacterium RIFOXYA12_FULL_57_11]OGS15086.1 MAG: hypothetical protein A2234_08935 [Elusimicrobia bacterium RIFOXYA2_FULL_58_8]
MPIDILLVSDEEGPLENYISQFMKYCLVTHTLALENGEAGWPNLHPPHLSIAVLAAYLRKNGRNPEFIDNIFRVPENWAQMLRLLGEGTPVLGISTSLLFNPDSVRRIVTKARSINPKVIIVLGGASARHPEIMELGDIAVTGPGEKPLLDIVNVLKAGGSLSDIKGIWHRVDGRMAYTGDAACPPMDDLPFPDWPAAVFHSSNCYPLEDSRGCVHSCAFCSYPNSGGHVFRAPALVVDELAKNREKAGIRLYRFMDSDLAARPEHTEKLCELIAARGLDLQWSCYARVDSLVKRPGLAAKMRAAGCVNVFLGIESGDDGILGAMNKGYGSAMIPEGVAAAREAGILTHGNFIIGFPGETSATVDATLEIIRRSRLDTAAFFLFWVHRNSASPVWNNKQNWGLEGDGVCWRHRTMDSAAAELQIGRAMRTVLTEMPETLIGNEYWITLMMGYGLSTAECLAFLRAVREYHLASLRQDADRTLAAQSAILAVMRKMNMLAKNLNKARQPA